MTDAPQHEADATVCPRVAIILAGPPDELILKLEREGWTTEEWAEWWGQWFDRKAEKAGIRIEWPSS